MKLQRQHFLLSYLKTLSVGPVGVSNSRPPASQPGAQPSETPVRGESKYHNICFHKNDPCFPWWKLEVEELNLVRKGSKRAKDEELANDVRARVAEWRWSLHNH